MVFLVFMFFISSVILAVSSKTWLVWWISVEILSFWFISLVLSLSRGKMKSDLWSYFLVQALTSSVILVSGSSSLSQLMNFSFESNFLVFLGLNLKLALPPFHMWGVQISENLTWLGFFLFNSLVKLPPLLVLFLSSFSSLNFLFSAFWAVSSLIFGTLAFSFRQLLVFSSVLNLSWMQLVSQFSLKIAVFFFVSYVFFLFCVSISESSFFPVSKVSGSEELKNTFIFFLLVFAFIGFPPFLPFFMKILSVLEMFSKGFFLLSSFFLCASAFMVKPYLPLFHIASAVSWEKKKERSSFLKTFSQSIVLFLSFFVVAFL